MESLKSQLSDLKDYQSKAKELEKEKNQLKGMNEENVQKLKSLQEREKQSRAE